LKFSNSITLEDLSEISFCSSGSEMPAPSSVPGPTIAMLVRFSPHRKAFRQWLCASSWQRIGEV
jgi:hypothetical protein